MNPHESFLFGDHRIATAGRGRSRFGHSFGGPPDRRGASRADCGGILLHLLHRFDLTDPAVPVAVPGVRWLPLYYSFDYRVNSLGYRLVSDDAMEAFFPADDPNVSAEEAWPDDDYPMEFPKASIAVVSHRYDPTDLDDAYRWAGVFGIGRLSIRKQAAARKRVADQMEGLGFWAPESDEQFDAALSSPFPQGKPEGYCPNPACDQGKRAEPLTTIALLPAEPMKGVRTFGENGGGVKLVFQMCPACHAIRVTNQSG